VACGSCTGDAFTCVKSCVEGRVVGCVNSFSCGIVGGKTMRNLTAPSVDDCMAADFDVGNDVGNDVGDDVGDANAAALP
jgi:hypothetical protein